MMSQNNYDGSICVRKFGLAWGFTFAFFMFIFGIVAMVFGIWVDLIELCSKAYIGFEPSFIGSLKGAGWGFIEGSLIGSSIAFVYNRI